MPEFSVNAGPEIKCSKPVFIADFLSLAFSPFLNYL
jgi:hypothetical protein